MPIEPLSTTDGSGFCNSFVTTENKIPYFSQDKSSTMYLLIKLVLGFTISVLQVYQFNWNTCNDALTRRHELNFPVEVYSVLFLMKNRNGEHDSCEIPSRP
jgi:hypothetical protein